MDGESAFVQERRIAYFADETLLFCMSFKVAMKVFGSRKRHVAQLTCKRLFVRVNFRMPAEPPIRVEMLHCTFYK